MSREHVQEFFRLTERDPNLRQELERALEQKDGAVTAFLAAAAARGLDFTAQEFVDALPACAAGSGELDDAELEKVAGGVGTATTTQTTTIFLKAGTSIRNLSYGPKASTLGAAVATEEEEVQM